MARDNVPDSERCKARSKQSGSRCKRRRSPGFEVCAMHGGKTPRGVSSPHFLHGARARSLPERLRAAYQAALENPDVDDLRPQIALLEAREVELLGRLPSRESGAAWSEAEAALEQLLVGMQSKDTDKMHRALERLRVAIAEGRDDDRQWRELRENMAHRRRLVDSQRRRVEASHQYLTVVEVMALAGRLASIVREEIDDPETLRRLLVKWEQAMVPATSGEAPQPAAPAKPESAPN